MKQEINLEEIFNKYRQLSPNLLGMIDIEYFKPIINMMIYEGINQALGLAAENAITKTNKESTSIIVDMNSILQIKDWIK